MALENPPLLVVSDTKRFRIYTNWTNTVQEKHEFTLGDLAHSGTRELLRNVFRAPDKFKPAKTREQVTEGRPRNSHHFRSATHGRAWAGKGRALPQSIVFCLFAEDVSLLQDDLFKKLLDNVAQRRDRVPEASKRRLSQLSRR